MLNTEKYMSIIRLALMPLYMVLLSLIVDFYVFAGDQLPPQSYPYPWDWHGMHWPTYWWIFPLMFFVMMLVLFIFIIKKGGMCWRGGNMMMDESEFYDAVKRYIGKQSESALEILDKRYAKGEIDKQEYEEKKAAISHTN